MTITDIFLWFRFELSKYVKYLILTIVLFVHVDRQLLDTVPGVSLPEGGGNIFGSDKVPKHDGMSHESCVVDFLSKPSHKFDQILQVLPKGFPTFCTPV